MALTLSLPPIDPRPANPPETRPSKVFPWLDDLLTRDPVEAARVIGDSLAAINRVELSDSKRLELAERYWTAANTLWPPLERLFSKASHPLSGDALESAKAALGLAHELSVAYKHLLRHESEKRLLLTGNRLLVALLHRCLQCTARVLVNSYLSYSPVPPKSWLDAHAIYAFSRERQLHQHAIAHDQPEMTPERVYLQALLLALANPYGFLPGQLSTVVRYLQEFCHWAKLTDVVPVHRMAKAVAIIPVGHDFPPFSANKGGSIDGSKIFLLTFDLAFQIQEQLRALEAGGEVPAGIARDPAGRLQYVALLKRLLRQWAIPPARQFNRLPSRARVVMCAGLTGVWQYSRGTHAGVAQPPTGLPPMTACQVINHTPAGYALRQTDPNPTALRIGDLIALRVEGRTGVQVAMVRWFRNTLKSSGLEFGCELLSDSPEAAAAAAEDASEGSLAPVVVLPEDRTSTGPEASPPQLLVPSGVFAIEQGISLKRGNDTGFAVLLKLAEQGPGFELYDFAPVG
jgi:cyclic-di-GMP-binding protein